MKNKKDNKLRVNTLENNIYALKLMWRICPSLVVHKVIVRALGYFEWLFYSAFFMRYVVNAMDSEQSFNSIMIFLAGTVAVFGGISFYNSYVEGKVNPITQIIVNGGLNKRLFKKARNVELACFEDSEFYNKYTLAMDKADEKLIETVDVIWGVILGIAATVAAFAFMYSVDKWSILFIIFPVLGNFVFTSQINKIEFLRNKDMTPHNRKIAYVNRVMYLSDYAKEMRLTNVFSMMKRDYSQAIKGLIDTTRKYTKRAMVFHWLSVIFTFSLIFEGLLLYGSYRTLVSHTMSLAQLAVTTSMMVSTTWILIGFTESITKGIKNGLFISNLKTFIEYEEKIPENEKGDDPGREIKSIEFRNVSFSYKDKAVISNLSFEIRDGKTYALVGHNGAGKSTIIKLLMRFYDPTEGEILCNGRNIKEYELQKYRALFATAFQDCQVFSLSVIENVLMRKADKSDDLSIKKDEKCVADVLRLAGVYDKVMSLPQGMYTKLTKEFDPDGAVLSGGEYQKIGVARAFVQQCPIKIFDEPSSALDPIAEYMLFDNILRSSIDKTMLFISHRLSSVQNADWVFMLENGTIKEEGTHEMLMKKQGTYADMYEKQAENYLAKSPGTVRDSIFPVVKEANL